ncbi:MAG TPA: hypothetical protein DCS07_03650 [Bdellovibrionales bacterium]|nr:MAG: hypothetical protein A2Z97_12265 [Bdellovibrionales bacterium GWB1_52_6]OFZ03716.1 MAG: hypothetical protein A2X97_14245 [Bdellovibrionales bacterium GWA1_52_35]OFZ41134.1 MAG: hypothetical protein A2070_08710 [Bdellovibrionales bacterium GWC1_52_8]HAR41713.1 hypothetical protein [Bdellovibrionales bacterium]HCM38772.1 hypothetical protein [Bdellovibrionales bacterium]
MRPTLKNNLFFIAALAVLCFPALALAWTVTADFDNTGFSGSGSFSGNNGSYVTVSTDRAAYGTKSAKMYMSKGDGGTYGSLTHPLVTTGAEVWARAYYYFASPWSWGNAINAPDSAIKVFRPIHFEVPPDQSWYLSVFGNSYNQIMLSNEAGDAQPRASVGFDIDKWQCIDMYVKLSATQGIFRIWKNEQLIVEDIASRTMPFAGAVSDGIAYVMSNWNNGTAQAQTMYVDEVIITTERPSKVDANKYPLIGYVGAPTAQPKPKAPTGLSVR